ncbi:hypothetical protein ABL78_5013 [Leptomonas seymouri]|uniref:Cilia- and flagella-associated protein 418 n=1 Tax=Leptomonas seymouri TaxID=5684 RepID=A0A0N0P513_LEPSE|nr:hypothetical protein ABL78_5013 [Leptomonas seymouri]|eukprot:KPI85929.1 hypothetical protein ABL78_5013 [Leptomonas seymouri]
MSGTGVDDLISELFPKAAKSNLAPNSSDAPFPSGGRQSEWDDDDDDDGSKECTSVKAQGRGDGSYCTPTHAVSSANPGHSSTTITTAVPRHSLSHAFDDDSSEDEKNDKSGVGTAKGQCGASAPARSLSGVSQCVAPIHQRGRSSTVIHPVPFPSLADSGGAFACAQRCYLTNCGASLRGDDTHPTVLQLRSLAANELSIAVCTRAQAMLKKGALHAALAKLGNGCLDNRGDCTNNGGCPFILCRKCNYMVVRLQGAEWDDDHGKVNLYLTLRNYYPDWCRLASTTPVGVEDMRGADRYVLKANPTAAAYCCQCSWETVRCAKAVIETKLTDAFLVKSGADEAHPFATEMPLVLGEKRRPPLWVCHGHPH